MRSRVDYTAAELEWVKNNPVIYYSDDISWEPFVNLTSKNRLEGISVDYLKLIEEKTELRFEFIKSDNWSQVMENLKTRKIHLVLAAIYAPERENFASFTDPYFSSPLAMITGPQYSYIQSIEEIYGKTVAVPKDYYTYSYLKNNHPKLNFKIVAGLDDALRSVSQNQADAFVGYLPVAVYKLKLSHFNNLKISGTIDDNLKVRMMVAKGAEPLASIINKSLDQISENEKRQISDKWFNVAVETGINPKTVFNVIALVVFLGVLTLFWIMKLRKEIRLREITEKALIQAREEAEKANQAKSEFLANMSHEIRTPMNAVFGYSQLLSETKLDSEQKQYLDAIATGSNGLLHIINDILEISKIEAGKMKIEMEPVNVARLVAEVKQLFKDSMAEKSLEFTTNLSEKVPVWIISDGNRLRQILINMVGNALKFTDKGFVNIQVFYSDDQSLCFTVEDSGVGIEPTRFQSIFDHFEYQISPSASHVASSGLGLSICKKLAEKLGGTIEVESQIGKGSRFTLRLFQIVESQPEPGEQDRVEDKKLNYREARVLIVDDVTSNRLILEKYLSSFPFHIEHADNGQAAVEAVRRERPDLVFMDVRMPIMDGFDATTQIKSFDPSIPVVAVTASALESESSRKRNQIFDDFLRKPILKAKIIKVVGDYLSTTQT
nr:transporter substrate-binding domain-containing protein [Aliikangiella sp. G2MR2-5]